MKKKISAILALALASTLTALAVDVDINVNVKHSIGGVESFDREKFITIHSAIDDREWTHYYQGVGNFTNNLMGAFMEAYDVYFGRDTGPISYYRGNVITEDPAKPGWASESSFAYWGNHSRDGYNTQINGYSLQPYEHRANNVTLCTQFAPFWPNTSNYNGWAFSTNDTPSEPFGSATGHYDAFYIKEMHSADSRALPKYFEVTNEPDWPLWGGGPPDTATELTNALKLWKYHNSVADQIRAVNGTNVLIGGYCSAFPDFENDNFAEWNVESKAFIDTCGTNMDFMTIHLYCRDDIGGSKYIVRGSNLEATMDMIEHYSNYRLGKPLPIAVSEFAGKDHISNYGDWSSYQDWKHIKALSSMVMSFADRPHIMGQVIPFIPCKAEWGRGTYPYSARLMRQADEPASYTGEWVFTDKVKFYQLWSDVKGTRVDITSSDPDIQVDAYVDDDKVYVILNNLNYFSTTVDLNMTDYFLNTVVSVKEKNLYLNGSNITTLDEFMHTGDLAQVQLSSEGTAILEYTFASSVYISETSDEEKHYAADHVLHEIFLYTPYYFDINGVEKGPYGEAVLRLGLGREHHLSKQPVVEFNGTELTVPTDLMGHEGDANDIFFGMVEIPVPYDLIQSNNQVMVYFTDTGGHLSSLSLRTYAFSTDVRNGGPVPTDPGAIITSTELSGSDLILSISNGIPNGLFDLMASDDLLVHGSNWVSSRLGLRFDGAGEAIVTNPVTESQEFYRTWEPGTMVYPVTGVAVTPQSATVAAGGTVQLTAEVLPVNATDPTFSWSSDTPAVATVDSNGLVTAVADGTAVITATTTDGGYTDSCTVSVQDFISATFDWTEASGLSWWTYSTSYQYTETDNTVTMKHGGAAGSVGSGKTRATVNGTAAFKWIHQVDAEPGQFTMWIGSTQKDFVVTSIDYAAGTAAGLTGFNELRGLKDGVVQWTIQTGSALQTFTSATTGDLGLLIDEIVWYNEHNASGESIQVWDNQVDNLQVLIFE